MLIHTLSLYLPLPFLFFFSLSVTNDDKLNIIAPNESFTNNLIPCNLLSGESFLITPGSSFTTYSNGLSPGVSFTITPGQLVTML